MTTDRIKLIAIILFVLPFLAIGMFRTTPVKGAAHIDGDAAATYKGKCLMCHTATASKFFDATKADADLVQVILKGKKGEKPPPMPEFESKGITAADAQELVTYMKSLKAPTN